MKVFGKQMPVSAAIGMAIVGVIAVASLCAPLIAPHGETETVGDIWMTPGVGHWLGTDSIGRDMLSRLLYGGRTTLGLALAITLLSFSLGIVTGFAAAVLGRKVDHVLSRIVDTLMAMPVLIFALMILSVLGTSMPVLIGTIAILDSTRVFRLARLVAQGIAVQEYVEAARLRGEGLAWIIRREILPNAVPPLLAEFGMRFGFTILFVAGLSFLGLGIQPPYADWGGMVRDNAQVINFGGIAPLVPAAAIALLTVGINLIVDWLLSVRAIGQAGAIA